MSTACLNCRKGEECEDFCMVNFEAIATTLIDYVEMDIKDVKSKNNKEQYNAKQQAEDAENNLKKALEQLELAQQEVKKAMEAVKNSNKIFLNYI